MRVPCDGCQRKSVDAKRDWIFLYNLKLFVCDDCASTRFDALYDQIHFDWWEKDLENRREIVKGDQIKRLGALSPTALIEMREGIASSLRKRA